VTQLAALVREALERELGPVMVAGEISNLRAAPSGHLYFTLKDERSQLRCVMFRNAAELLVFTPADGQEVIVRGKVDVYAARGDLQLYAEALDPQGRGALQLAFEQLKERLAAEGLFDEARKRPLPFFPRHIGIATAIGGAVLRDILVILGRRCPALHVVVRSARVQGVGAADDIVDALADLNMHPALEVLILARGGGSLEDLWSFNEERVARAIAASRLPVISAVGHEVDFTIADLVADHRAPTPTAAAELVVPRVADLAARIAGSGEALADGLVRRCRRERGRVEDLTGRVRDPRRRAKELRGRTADLGERMDTVMRRRVEMAAGGLEGAVRRLGLQHPARRMTALAAAVTACRRRLELATDHAVGGARDRLERVAGTLHDLSPLAVLQRGYSLTRRWPDGTIVRDVAALGAGDQVEITFAVGTARARVESSRRRRTP